MMTKEAFKKLLCRLRSFYYLNHSVSQPYHTIFVILFSAISVISLLCNLLLLISLHTQHKHRLDTNRRLSRLTRHVNRHIRRRPKLCEKIRDSLIGYLAALYFLLSITMPLTAFDDLTNYWPLGISTEVLARLIRAVPTAIVYASSMMISLIAINCHRQIIHSSKRQLTPRQVRYIVGCIIILSAVFASPIFYHTKLTPLIDEDLTKMSMEMKYEHQPKSENYSNTYNISTDLETQTLSSVASANEFLASNVTLVASNESKIQDEVCTNNSDLDLSFITFVFDDWPDDDNSSLNWKLHYSIFAICSQLIIPFAVISFCYYSVYRRLNQQAEIQKRVKTGSKIRNENERKKKRNTLFVTMSLVYLITWLPFFVFGTLSDANVSIFGVDPETISVIIMSCHLIGMSNACVNPVIYGYRNKHLRNGNYKQSLIK